ncbi:MAG TPA: glycosyltransferase family A protein [bacterium]|nr:glycosyltransferase family 2 protein [Chlamydiota bacterium]HOE27560.1 glycosyltransferase family A protein [bacterium]
MISVVVLTHNRLPFLRDCVESIRANGYADHEIVVVDNASTDGTAEALAGMDDVRVVRFDRDRELAACRNAGIDAARGDIIAFTDDDCAIEKDWLVRIEADLRDHDAVGGVALPLGDFHPPRWWDDEINWLVGLSVPGHYGPRAGEVYLPASLNLAYRAPVLRALGFREGAPGLAGRNMTREDSDLWLRTRAGGHRTLFDPSLVVYHRVPPERLTVSFCVRRAFSDGFSAWHRGETGGGLRRTLAYVLAQPFTLAARMIRGGGRPRAKEWVWPVRQAGLVWGGIVQGAAAITAAARDTAKAVPGVLHALLIILREAALLACARGLLKTRGPRTPPPAVGGAPHSDGGDATTS